jgi:hypothetical protein
MPTCNEFYDSTQLSNLADVRRSLVSTIFVCTGGLDCRINCLAVLLNRVKQFLLLTIELILRTSAGETGLHIPWRYGENPWGGVKVFGLYPNLKQCAELHPTIAAQVPWDHLATWRIVLEQHMHLHN